MHIVNLFFKYDIIIHGIIFQFFSPLLISVFFSFFYFSVLSYSIKLYILKIQLLPCILFEKYTTSTKKNITLEKNTSSLLRGFTIVIVSKILTESFFFFEGYMYYLLLTERSIRHCCLIPVF